jgi:hypothetical protein
MLYISISKRAQYFRNGSEVGINFGAKENKISKFSKKAEDKERKHTGGLI